MDLSPLTPRFGIPEQHGEGVLKIRTIDDFRASGINNILDTVDTSIPENLDVALACISLYKHLAPGCILNISSADFAHAYKHVPLTESQKDFATIVFCSPDGIVHSEVLRTQPSGSRRAPANWGRVAAFAEFVLFKIFGVVMFVFVDDCFIIEPRGTCAAALSALNVTREALGLALEHSEEVQPTTDLLLLGAEISLRVLSVEASLPDKKRVEISEELAKILVRKTLTPAEAAKLRGKLGYAQSLMFGRWGRAMLSPFSDRQYSLRPGRFHPLSVELS